MAKTEIVILRKKKNGNVISVSVDGKVIQAIEIAEYLGVKYTRSFWVQICKTDKKVVMMIPASLSRLMANIN